LLLVASTVLAEVAVPNPGFREQDPAAADRPDAWRLSGGAGGWVGGDRLEVTGKGTEASSSYWHCDGVGFEPAGLYRFEMVARRVDGAGGCAVSGPTFANRDHHQLTSNWQTVGHVFRVPDGLKSGTVRVGQWSASGSHQFDSVRIVPVLPVHTATGSMVLGQGESIRDGRYRFRGTFDHPGSNYHRTLLRTTTSFNSNRWTFSTGNEVVYRFELPGCRFKNSRISLNVNHYVRGTCAAEASADGENWQAALSQGKLGGAEAALPAALSGAKTIYLKLRAEGESSFQVDRMEFEAALDGEVPQGTGKTAYAEIGEVKGTLAIEQLLMRDASDGKGSRLEVTLRNHGARAVPVRLAGAVASAKGGLLELPASEAEVGPGQTRSLPIELLADQPGEHTLQLEIAGRDADAGLVRASLAFDLPDYYRADYGQLVANAGGTGLWWCDATHKIPRTRALPTASGKAAQMAAARNDWEAVQVVVRPEKELKGLTASLSAFQQPGSEATIPVEDMKILRTYYHFVDHPTDATGVRDYWPDALPPLDGPIDVEAGQNQPLWVLVHVPENAKPGDYRATLALRAEGFSADLPVGLHVWDFTLPKRSHLKTAFGFSVGSVFQYHGLKTEEDKRKVVDLYLKSFGDHRISPYDPTPLDPIRVKFVPEADPPKAEVDFAAFDEAMERAVREYGFNNFRLGIQGMGGGTFHERHDPSIAGFGEDTPEYQAMFASQVQQIEAHLREKGWLDMAFVYWFDEPDPKDYEFVANGMKRLEKYAPGLVRMITEQPSDEFDAHVNVWCPVSHNYDHAAAEARRAQGERFWWYVCTGPKAPYCTLFIDHPATELRIWHWQTWQRDIVGTLVWQSNYWTSSAAFPDHPQNPYEDPMGYVSGYSTPKGTKRFWGNGDGRFIYPPLAAATPSRMPVLEPPVTSIRWEMLREGVEDYEYLFMLRELLAEKGKHLPEAKRAELESLLEVPDSITKDMTTFATHPRPIYERRQAIAEAIEGLGSGR
jgi:hypothetical protein